MGGVAGVGAEAVDEVEAVEEAGEEVEDEAETEAEESR